MNAEATTMNPVPARKRRTRVRRLVGAAGATLLTGALVTGVGQPAHAFTIAYNLYDLDGNGQTDASVVDATGPAGVPDGIADANLADTNRDGLVDDWLIDRNQDGVVDVWAVDGDGDHVPSTWYVDWDQNNAEDGAFVDTDGNGTPDAIAGSTGGMTMTPSPFGGLNLGIGGTVRPADPRDQCLVSGDPFDCVQWPQVGGNASPYAAIPPGVTIAAGLQALDNAATANSYI